MTSPCPVRSKIGFCLLVELRSQILATASSPAAKMCCPFRNQCKDRMANLVAEKVVNVERMVTSQILVSPTSVPTASKRPSFRKAAHRAKFPPVCTIRSGATLELTGSFSPNKDVGSSCPLRFFPLWFKARTKEEYPVVDAAAYRLTRGPLTTANGGCFDVKSGPNRTCCVMADRFVASLSRLGCAYFALAASYLLDPKPNFCVQYRASFESAKPSCPNVTEDVAGRLVCRDAVVLKFRFDGVAVSIVVVMLMVV